MLNGGHLLVIGVDFEDKELIDLSDGWVLPGDLHGKRDVAPALVDSKVVMQIVLDAILSMC